MSLYYLKTKYKTNHQLIQDLGLKSQDWATLVSSEISEDSISPEFSATLLNDSRKIKLMC